MTNWMPTLSGTKGPMYLRLADAIARDIVSGALPSGARLPPQRDLAYDLGVTVGTVGRAYAQVRQRGLVAGEVGRGTFVCAHENAAETASRPEKTFAGGTLPASPEIAGTRVVAPRPGVIIMDSTAAPDVGQAAVIQPITTAILAEHPNEIASYTRVVPDRWREAGQRWLSTGGWQPAIGDIVPALGGHAAIMAVMTAVTAPGDRIVFEELTYSSFARSANLIGRHPVQVACDAEGAVPEDLERVCAQQHPKLLFLMPEAQNPTLAVMSKNRRAEIADIARRHNLWLVEDAIYGKMATSPLAPLAAYLPERTFHVGGLSKSVSAGIRAAWVACPNGYAQRTHIKHKMISGGLAFLLGELAARLILEGIAEDVLAKAKDELDARHALAVEAFTGHEFAARPDIPFIWLKLPDPWLSGQFRQAAANDGVLVDDEDEFKPTRTERIHHRVRIGFTTPKTRSETMAGFTILRRLLHSAGTGYDSFN